jgi:hypothetical protein
LYSCCNLTSSTSKRSLLTCTGFYGTEIKIKIHISYLVNYVLVPIYWTGRKFYDNLNVCIFGHFLECDWGSEPPAPCHRGCYTCSHEISHKCIFLYSVCAKYWSYKRWHIFRQKLPMHVVQKLKQLCTLIVLLIEFLA